VNNTTKVVRAIELGMEGDKTVVMRVEFNDSYTAIEWHDRLAVTTVPFTLTFSGRKPDVVNMEKARHPIESFPVPKDDSLPASWILGWLILSWCWASLCISWLT
jgi:hypothetical protein